LGLFNIDFNRPGPGVSENEPRKKGLLSFVRIVAGNFGDLIKLNLLFFICVIPTATLFILGLIGFNPVVMFLLSLPAAFPVGGAAVALTFCITKMLRSEPGYVWHDFKRKFLENAGQAAVPGILCVAFIYAHASLWCFHILAVITMNAGLLVIGFASIVFFGMIAPYIFTMIAYLDLKTRHIIRNSVLLALLNIPRSFMGTVTSGVMWIAFVLFLPVSLFFIPIIALLGFSLTWLLWLMWGWPSIDRQFTIEETLRKRRDGENDSGSEL